jgi:hypothetical protein
MKLGCTTVYFVLTRLALSALLTDTTDQRLLYSFYTQTRDHEQLDRIVV